MFYELAVHGQAVDADVGANIQHDLAATSDLFLARQLFVLQPVRLEVVVLSLKSMFKVAGNPMPTPDRRRADASR